VAVVGIPGGKVPSRRHILLESGDFSTIFTAGEGRFPARVAKFFFGSGFFRSLSFLPVSCRRGRESGRRRGGFLWAARRGSFAKATAHKLVEALGLCAGGVPFLVEPVQVRVVIRDPFLDGLPDHKERTVCWPLGGRWSRAAAMKSGAVKISKLRLVVWWRLER